ncbi:MAG: reverse transcriptase family protein [Candidatus Competibacteraceae bacterium]
MRKIQSYPLDQSPIFRLHSKRKLVELLGISLKDLRFLLSLDNYRVWETHQKRQDMLAGLPPPTKARKIQQPKPLLFALHKRLALLLSRIQKPEFVYSATKGRSYVDNASQHKNIERVVKVDIKNFYPSIERNAVRNFFAYDMQCAPDVAHVLSLLCCVNESLSTGSPLSPVLSYFACLPLFRKIANMAAAQGLIFTLYVDDMVFSGANATRGFSRLVVDELARNGFVGHKISHFSAAKVKIITGVAVWPNRIGVPHKRQKRIRLFEKAFWLNKNPDEIKILGATLLGQYREAERLQQGSRMRAKPIQDRLDVINSEGAAVLSSATKRRRPRVSLRCSKKVIEKLRKHSTSEAFDVPIIPN